jgi:signal transduction histidine kinase
MSASSRILGVATAFGDLDWFRSAWRVDSGELVVVQPDAIPGDVRGFDAALLDEGIGLEAARLAIADLHVARTSLPVLAGVDAANWLAWESLIRLGLQDILFRDLDRPPELMRRVAGAVHQARVLHATQEAEIRLRTIIENIEDGVLILNPQNVILFANPAAEDLLGRSLDELFGLEIPFDVPRKGDDTVLFEQGDIRSLHVRTYDVTWEGLDGTLITLRDMTAEQEIREQLRLARKTAEEASAMKSTFLANMSHELRMPLASIIGFAQIIGEGTENPDFKEFAEAIEDSGNRLLTSINAVLEATRLEKQHIDPFLQEVRVDAVVEEVVASLQPLVQNDQVTLRWQGTGSPVILADEDFVVRILNNLIGNATKFTEKGTITVSWKELPTEVMLEVADTGRGISAEFIPRLFDEFSQESIGASRSHEGTGLGLTIVKGLVDLLGGRIEVESTPGKGSTFRVYIPRGKPSS